MPTNKGIHGHVGYISNMDIQHCRAAFRQDEHILTSIRLADESAVTLVTLPDSMIKLELDVEGTWKWEPGQHAFCGFLIFDNQLLR